MRSLKSLLAVTRFCPVSIPISFGVSAFCRSMLGLELGVVDESVSVVVSDPVEVVDESVVPDTPPVCVEIVSGVARFAAEFAFCARS